MSAVETAPTAVEEVPTGEHVAAADAVAEVEEPQTGEAGDGPAKAKKNKKKNKKKPSKCGRWRGWMPDNNR